MADGIPKWAHEMYGTDKAIHNTAARRAFERFRGPVDKVRRGDFQRALELLDECRLPSDSKVGKKVIRFLNRLRPGDDD